MAPALGRAMQHPTSSRMPFGPRWTVQPHRLVFAILAVSTAAACDAGPDTGNSQGRLVVAGGDGSVASMDLSAPFAVRAHGNVGADLGSVRCRAGRCVGMRGSPSDTVVLFDASDLAVLDSFPLKDFDPRDAAFVEDDVVVLSGHASSSLRILDLATRLDTPLDLGSLADADGNPEADRMAVCGRRVFVQLDRIDSTTGIPDAAGARLAVVDVDANGAGSVVDVDAVSAGLQGIALANRPAFDMVVDCEAHALHVAEPLPLFQGGGAYETVALDTFVVSEFPIAGSAQIGGFAVVSTDVFWVISHTDFGPGASSHLEYHGSAPTDTYNTFSGQHVDELAFDRVLDLVYFPDPCTVTPSNASCLGGVHVFDGTTGAQITSAGVDVGFTPSEVELAR